VGIITQLMDKCINLKNTSYFLGSVGTKEKNQALRQVASSLNKYKKLILAENKKDMDEYMIKNNQTSLLDRLYLNEERIDSMIDGINKIIGLKDPVWSSRDTWTLENGLTIGKMTVPIGVIAIIYESRPNVTVDAFALALKSGNCILLRGSSSAIRSNAALVHAIKDGLKNSPIPESAVELIDDTSREIVSEMLTLNHYIDLVIPRGGADLIQFVVQSSTIPTIETGVGNCHIFVDEYASFEDALKIIENAKIQRPGVCNACETVLVHENIAKRFLPLLNERIKNRVVIRGCEETLKVIEASVACEDDWEKEYLDYILAVKVVASLEDAVSHIHSYGTKHSEAIITENLNNARIFLRKVDAAAVYVNASTRFTDGEQFGFGAEMGISTQKLHPRGPIGLNELVTSKYVIMGSGQIRE